MIHLISIFTITFTIFAAGIVTFSAKKNLNLQLKSCVEFTTALNRNRRKTLEHLFSLNPKAKVLRAKRRTAEAAYKSAPTPPLRAAAFAVLQSVKALQKIFRLYQKTVLTKLKLHTAAFKAKSIKQRQRIQKISYKSLVAPHPKKSDSPGYKKVKSFTKLTKVLVKKRVNLARDLPIFFTNLLTQKKGYIECGSIITVSKNKMKTKLLGGRSF